MLSTFVISFLPRSKRLLFCGYSLSALILEPKKMKTDVCEIWGFFNSSSPRQNNPKNPFLLSCCCDWVSFARCPDPWRGGVGRKCLSLIRASLAGSHPPPQDELQLKHLEVGSPSPFMLASYLWGSHAESSAREPGVAHHRKTSTSVRQSKRPPTLFLRGSLCGARIVRWLQLQSQADLFLISP